MGNGATIAVSTVPDAPKALVRDSAVSVSQVKISLTWQDGDFNGLQPVLDYRLYFDQGTGDWAVLDLPTTNTFTAFGLTSGTTYSFKVQSRNIVGYSEFSSSISLTAA